MAWYKRALRIIEIVFVSIWALASIVAYIYATLFESIDFFGYKNADLIEFSRVGLICAPVFFAFVFFVEPFMQKPWFSRALRFLQIFSVIALASVSVAACLYGSFSDEIGVLGFSKTDLVKIGIVGLLATAGLALLFFVIQPFVKWNEARLQKAAAEADAKRQQ